MTSWTCDLHIVGYLSAATMSRVRDVLGPEFSVTESSTTWIVARVPDQSGLLGVLDEIHGLGLSVREVHRAPIAGTQHRQDPHVVYLVRIAERVGPLMTAALAEVQVTQVLAQTQLVVAGPESVWQERLPHLYGVGLDIERISCRVLDDSDIVPVP